MRKSDRGKHADLPRIIIAGSSSGCGKTSITLGILRALRNRGVQVVPFKAGPDYIDPGHLSFAAGANCRNLDPILMGSQGVFSALQRNCSSETCAVIEGVMGLYDGRPAEAADSNGSTAALARLLGAPVVVVLDVKASAQSAGAIALGMKLYDPDCPVAGFILNRVGSDRHYNMARIAVEGATGLPVLGRVSKLPDGHLPERHLGLVPAWEAQHSDDSELAQAVARIAEEIEQHVSLDRLLEIAADAAPLNPPESRHEETAVYAPGIELEITANSEAGPKSTRERQTQSTQGLRIAYALDDAFHFYYQDNLDVLRDLGAILLPFSPIDQQKLPEDIDGIYFGGGYPELHAEKLAANTRMREALIQTSSGGMPIYGECGGFMYLAQELRVEGASYAMVGLFPVAVQMERKLSALGYHNGHTLRDSLFGPAGTVLSGHVYRWSKVVLLGEEPAWIMELEKGATRSFDTLAIRNTVAGYLHLHFAGSPQVAHNFLHLCGQYHAGRKHDQQHQGQRHHNHHQQRNVHAK
jgi:cobyrinic acid a,c-diamide synthase